MSFWVVAVVFGVLFLACLDRLLGAALKFLAPVLPNDLAGPHGWLVNTKTGCGVFDRKAQTAAA